MCRACRLQQRLPSCLVEKERTRPPPRWPSCENKSKIDLPKPKPSILCRERRGALHLLQNSDPPHEMTMFRPSFPPLLSLLLLASLPLPAHPFASPSFTTSFVRSTAQRTSFSPAAPRLGIRAQTRARGSVGPMMAVGDVIPVTWEVRRQPRETGSWIYDAHRICFRCGEQGSGVFPRLETSISIFGGL